ncbi:hypothetical protein [Microbacterium aurantiacum]|uniref:hypothetical protein n=1 Tax=Microbacterium aurantiacum TaxID=162393 RepID=UPI001F26952C|nr:hypothetical protein [Microbacterium aurantiacum]
MQAQLAQAKPDLTAARRGWGSISEDPDILGSLMLQPPLTDPDLHPAVPGRRPEVLSARLYWFNALRSRVRHGVPVTPQYTLDATDILISEHGANEYLLVVASHNDGDIDNKVIPALKNAILSVDPNVSVASTTSPLHFDDPDFFLWLVNRWFASQPAGTGVDIDAFDHVMVRDPLRYQTAIAQGVQSDRPELLTLLAKPVTVFGPGRFSITSTTLGFGCELTLAVNGDFDIAARAISFAGGSFTSIPEMRLTAVTDLIYTVLPAMKKMYEGDLGWKQGGDRAAFRTKMKVDAQTLVARI